jgi:hypothetical protein
MNVSQPEADSEYSRGERGSEAARTAANTRWAGHSSRAAQAVVAAGLLGAALLLVAEFTPLLHVHSSARDAAVIKTIGTGSHHAFALLPVALLAAGLSLGARATGNRAMLLSIGALGLVALGIALIGDLPDARTSGLVGHAGGTYVSAASSPAIGLYLETLGAVLLLITTGAGLLLAPRPSPPADGRPRISTRRRSAS